MANSVVLRRASFYILFIFSILITSSIASWEIYQNIIQSRHMGSALLPFKEQYFKENISKYDLYF